MEIYPPPVLVGNLKLILYLLEWYYFACLTSALRLLHADSYSEVGRFREKISCRSRTGFLKASVEPKYVYQLSTPSLPSPPPQPALIQHPSSRVSLPTHCPLTMTRFDVPTTKICSPFPAEQADTQRASVRANRPEEDLVSLSKKEGPVSSAEVERIFNALQPVKPSFLIGEWDGGSLDTGHPGHKALATLRWAGKTFRSLDDADPMVVWDDEGRRVWKEDWGHSSVSLRAEGNNSRRWTGSTE